MTASDIDRLLKLARAFRESPGRTHYEGCHMDHPFCMIHKLADAIEYQNVLIDNLANEIKQYEEASPCQNS
jgi:hypothetical protein